MRRMTNRWQGLAAALAMGLTTAWAATPAGAHCDALDGPVALDVYASLDDGELDRVLKWVAADDEQTIRDVFDQAHGVRQLSDEARALADRHFLETVVRLHRQSEGAPYTGLRPAGQPQHPAVEEVDSAMDAESIDPLVEQLKQAVETAVRQRYDHAQATAADADESVADGRASVHAYVELVHYVKHLHNLLARDPHEPVQVHAEAHAQAHGGSETDAPAHEE